MTKEPVKHARDKDLGTILNEEARPIPVCGQAVGRFFVHPAYEGSGYWHETLYSVSVAGYCIPGGTFVTRFAAVRLARELDAIPVEWQPGVCLTSEQKAQVRQYTTRAQRCGKR